MIDLLLRKMKVPPPVCHTEHPQSIMMLGVVASNDEKCLPIFIKEKEKVNREV